MAQTMVEMDFLKSIHYACIENNIERVKKLKTKVNEVDGGGYSPLHYAAIKGNYQICKYLIDNGACVNKRTANGGVSCLMRACVGGHLEVAKLLLENGARFEKDNDGRDVFDIVEAMEDYTKKKNFLDLFIKYKSESLS